MQLEFSQASLKTFDMNSEVDVRRVESPNLYLDNTPAIQWLSFDSKVPVFDCVLRVTRLSDVNENLHCIRR